MKEIFSDLPTEYPRIASASEPLFVLAKVAEDPISVESPELAPLGPPVLAPLS